MNSKSTDRNEGATLQETSEERVLGTWQQIEEGDHNKLKLRYYAEGARVVVTANPYNNQEVSVTPFLQLKKVGQ